MKIENTCISEKLAKKIITNIGFKFNVYLDVLKFGDGKDVTHSLVGFKLPSITDEFFHKFTSYDEIPGTYCFEYYFIEAKGTDNIFINISTEESRKYRTALKEMMKLCSENRDIIYPHYGYGNSIVLIPKNTTIYELLVKHDLFFLEK